MYGQQLNASTSSIQSPHFVMALPSVRKIEHSGTSASRLLQLAAARNMGPTATLQTVSTNERCLHVAQHTASTAAVAVAHSLDCKAIFQA